MNPYLYMTKMKLLLSMNYRFDFFTKLAVQVILLFVTSFFWKAAYRGIDTVQMVNEQQMIIYSVMSIVLASVFTASVESNIRSKVRQGNVAVDYIKPVNVFWMYFAEDIGNMVTNIIQRVAPVLICASFFIVVPKPVSLAHFLLFLTSSCFSFLILWLISALVGLFYFKVIEMGPIGIIKDYLIRLLAGTFVPIWFFPSSVQTVLQFLPFIYTYQLPLSIFIGRTSLNDALWGMLIQILWVLIFFALFVRLKNHVERNILVQGG
ncbi:MAG: hypothetical protein CVU97_04180 [Firmicutes bacterium HGW-Firmicutes-21]|nr:MAG: hypothetical protein CVU97_04180 [Firmicutes bacterium HGW-Firmicutes-21]